MGFAEPITLNMALKNKQKRGHQESSTSSDEETLTGYASRITGQNVYSFKPMEKNS